MERLSTTKDKPVELDRVLLIADGEKVTAGSPLVEGARVLATPQGDGRGKKVIVFKYKAKVRYRKKAGHRQPYTRLSIDKILLPGEVGEKKPAVKRARRTKKEATEVKTDGA